MLVAVLLCSLPLALGPVFLALATLLPVLSVAADVPSLPEYANVASYGSFDAPVSAAPPVPLTRSERAARQPRDSSGRFIRAGAPRAPVSASYLDRFGTVPSVY